MIGGSRRVAVASIICETNTFSPRQSTLDDFRVQGLWLGDEADERSRGSNTEVAGAIERLREDGLVPVPIVRAWAMSDGPLVAPAYAELERILVDGLVAAGELDAAVLCLHGALVAVDRPAADMDLTVAARRVVGSVPLVVTHDLHANVTQEIVRAATAVVGFHTYPHVDQAETGRRAAALTAAALDGRAPGLGTVLAKRPMLVPAEAQAIADEPMAGIRRIADTLTHGPVLDISVYPVQPWLDVPQLGFAVTVTHDGDEEAAYAAAQAVADAAWRARDDFRVDLVGVREAVAGVDRAGTDGPVILVHSADSPTAGATADDATVIGALLAAGRPLRALATVVDGPAVADCVAAGVGAEVSTTLGATLDPRWSAPVPITGTVARIDDTPVVLAGESMTGQEIALGRWATIETAGGLAVLVTERAAPTFDPQGFRHAGLEPATADVVVVRSATMYRAGYRGISSRSVVLDLPGASTPAFSYLEFVNVPRPLFPLDEVPGSVPRRTRGGPVADTAPLLLGDNRVPVYYAGGRNISAFRGLPRPVDGPEDWVGSQVALPAAILGPDADPRTGISQLPDGRLIADAITADPQSWLGDGLAAAYGGSTALLVKLLDAGERLPVHCHPTRDFARRHLGSLFGKTEGWIVLRAEPDAAIWVGMREGVEISDLRRWVAAQDADAMLAAMLRLPVEAGTVVYVPAGAPHAIGPGVMLTELQEPTSFSILAEHEPFGVDEAAATLGVGWDVALSCFDLAAFRDRQEVILPAPRPLVRAAGGSVISVFAEVADEFFRAWRIRAAGSVTLPETSFAVLVVVAGEGAIEGDFGRLPVRAGQTLVAPHAAGRLTVDGDLDVIACLPPALAG